MIKDAEELKYRIFCAFEKIETPSINLTEVNKLMDELSKMTKEICFGHMWNNFSEVKPFCEGDYIVLDKQNRICIRHYKNGRWSRGKTDVVRWQDPPER